MKEKMDYKTFLMAGIRRRPGRNIAAIFCFAFIAANLFSAQYLMTGAAGSMDAGLSRMGADLLVVPVQYSAYYLKVGPENTAALVRPEASTVRMKPETLDTVRFTSGISRFSPQLYVSTLNLPILSSSAVDIFGMDPKTDFTIQPWLGKPLDRPLADGEVIMGNALHGNPGDRIVVREQTYTVAGRLDRTGTAIDRTLFLTLDDAYRLSAEKGVIHTGPAPVSPGEISAILVQLEPGVDPGVVSARIMQPSAAITVIPRHFTLTPVSQEVKDLPGTMNIVSAVVILSAVPLTALIASMVAHERRREIGLLKAMGATRRSVIALVMAESLALSAAGGILGIGVSLPVLAIATTQGILDTALRISVFMPSASDTLVIAGGVLVAIIAIGSVSSIYPAYRCGSTNIYEVIRSDE